MDLRGENASQGQTLLHTSPGQGGDLSFLESWLSPISTILGSNCSQGEEAVYLALSLPSHLALIQNPCSHPELKRPRNHAPVSTPACGNLRADAEATLLPPGLLPEPLSPSLVAWGLYLPSSNPSPAGTCSPRCGGPLSGRGLPEEHRHPKPPPYTS